MIKKIITCFVIIALVFTLFGCERSDEQEPGRFVIEYSQRINDDIGCNVRILRDTETGKAYLLYKHTYGAGATQLYEVAE